MEINASVVTLSVVVNASPKNKASTVGENAELVVKPNVFQNISLAMISASRDGSNVAILAHQTITEIGIKFVMDSA